MSKYPFPYESVEQGQKDSWRKLGGHDLITILRQGWYQIQNRKDRNELQSTVMAAAKKSPEFRALLEKAKQQVKKSA